MEGAIPNQPPTTSVTLLGRLKDPQDQHAWREFDARYRELLVRFLLVRGLQVADAEDVAQTAIAKLVSGLRSFDFDPARGRFRSYLYRAARNALCDHFAGQGHASAGVSTDGAMNQTATRLNDDEAFAAFEREWVDHHYRLAVQTYRQIADQRAIAMLDATIAGRAPRLIAEELGVTENAVHKAQQRLRERLRAIIAQQLKDEHADHER